MIVFFILDYTVYSHIVLCISTQLVIGRVRGEESELVFDTLTKGKKLNPIRRRRENLILLMLNQEQLTSPGVCQGKKAPQEKT